MESIFRHKNTMTIKGTYVSGMFYNSTDTLEEAFESKNLEGVMGELGSSIEYVQNRVLDMNVREVICSSYTLFQNEIWMYAVIKRSNRTGLMRIGACRNGYIECSVIDSEYTPELNDMIYAETRLIGYTYELEILSKAKLELINKSRVDKKGVEKAKNIIKSSKIMYDTGILTECEKTDINSIVEYVVKLLVKERDRWWVPGIVGTLRAHRGINFDNMNFEESMNELKCDTKWCYRMEIEAVSTEENGRTIIVSSIDAKGNKYIEGIFMSGSGMGYDYRERKGLNNKPEIYRVYKVAHLYNNTKYRGVGEIRKVAMLGRYKYNLNNIKVHKRIRVKINEVTNIAMEVGEWLYGEKNFIGD